MTKPIPLTRKQIADASKMVGELKELRNRETMPSIVSDPEGHHAHQVKIMDTSAKLEKLMPPEIESL